MSGAETGVAKAGVAATGVPDAVAADAGVAKAGFPQTSAGGTQGEAQVGAPRIAFYADDFTGATDTLATAARAGKKAILFLRVPDAALLARAGRLDVLGIAGAARSLDNEAMAAELGPVRDFLAVLGARVVHYKTCSTFDSSPTIGSIGTALACLRPLSPNPLVAIVGGQPNLSRYCVFANLFATVGAGGPVYRIDRHETMSRHPVTPMAEADLRLHLERQGLKSVASIDYTAYDLNVEALEARLDRLLAASPGAVLFDVGHSSHLPVVGRTLWQRATASAPLLAFGPSSVAQALIAHWEATEPSDQVEAGDRGDADVSGSAPGFATRSRVTHPAAGPVLVVSGSLSGVTARQRAQATSYVQVAVDSARLVQGGTAAVAATVDEIVAHLSAGRHVLAHTGGAGESPHPPKADAHLARATGELLRLLLESVPLRRIGIAGGDTSSYAVKALDCWGLSYLGDVARGSALCRLHADSASLDGLEVMLKGGQMGTPDVFERLLGDV